MNSSRFFKVALLAISISMSNIAFAKDEFYGLIEDRPIENAGVWTIKGKQLNLTDKTQIQKTKGDPVVGACVEVEHENGTVEELETVNPAMCKK